VPDESAVQPESASAPTAIAATAEARGSLLLFM